MAESTSEKSRSFADSISESIANSPLHASPVYSNSSAPTLLTRAPASPSPQSSLSSNSFIFSLGSDSNRDGNFDTLAQQISPGTTKASKAPLLPPAQANYQTRQNEHPQQTIGFYMQHEIKAWLDTVLACRKVDMAKLLGKAPKLADWRVGRN
ncbi:unnamed protein product [Protopolystoma xenopodis]|uniref:Uncharacterized protein n=1 Tax=Protopolystoma xenopodis TaxID=117903 RepID=A0A3S5A384_9PLAT|nr:unnamed protein product [Protopolystoma xenopodis]